MNMCPYSFNMAMPSHSYYILKKKKEERFVRDQWEKKDFYNCFFSFF